MKRALTALVAALALVLVPIGSAESSYSDPAGDAGSVPDITAVAVSNTDEGVLTFRVSANMAPNTVLFANLDTDANPSTGSYGIDRTLGFGVMPSGAVLSLVFDSNGTVLPGVAVPATLASGVLQFTFPKETFAVDQMFGFWLRTASLDEANTSYDDAPDVGFWAYVLTKPAPPPPAVVKPVIGKPVTTSAPIAGKRFTVSFPVTRSDSGAPMTGAAIACTTTVAGKVVPHRHAFSGGSVRATLVIPKAAKGKQLMVTLTLTTQNQTATKVVTLMVR